MIGVVVPAHNEQVLLPRCLRALQVAARHPDLGGEEVRIVIVLDSCTDATAAVAANHDVELLAVDARNVGIARAAGASALIAAGARWLAFTDADSEVAPCWLARQTALGTDAVCGVVTVDDWSGHSETARADYDAHYVDAENHGHVHGANLGVSTTAYLSAGGFMPLRSSEDVALVDRLAAIGASIARTNTVRVRTSARRAARAPDGFADFLCKLPGNELAHPASKAARFTDARPRRRAAASACDAVRPARCRAPS